MRVKSAFVTWRVKTRNVHRSSHVVFIYSRVITCVVHNDQYKIKVEINQMCKKYGYELRSCRIILNHSTLVLFQQYLLEKYCK